MVSQTLTIKALSQQFLSMFNLRQLSCSAKNFYLVVALLCAISIIVTCKENSVNEGYNQLETEPCSSYEGKFDTSSPNACNCHGTEVESKYSDQQHSLESICPSSTSFCFPSTLPGLLVNEIGVESEPSVASGVFAPGSEKLNLTWSKDHVIFRFLGERSISCSLKLRADFHISPSIESEPKSRSRSDVSSCMSPFLHNESYGSKSEQHSKSAKSGFSKGLSASHVEIRPAMLDWGDKNMYHPSLAFLTLKNLDVNDVLSVYDPYSSNSQFYPCNNSEIVMAPGEAASICFIFFPTQLGTSSAQLVLQTNFGGFLVQAKGSGVESPYLVKPPSGFDVSSSGSWRNNLSLFNPFNDTLYVEEIAAWVSVSSGNTSHSSSAVCRIHSTDYSGEYSVLSAGDWLKVERHEKGPEIALRPHKNWEIGPQKTERIVELDVSYNFEGKFIGALCLQLLRPSQNESDTIMIPLEAERHPISAPDSSSVSVSVEALVPCDTSDSLVVALSIRNQSPNLVSVLMVREVGESTDTFQIKSVKGLILFPNTITQVAVLNYAHAEAQQLKKNCKLLVMMNDTINSHLEVPCEDVMNVCSGRQLDSSVGHINGRQRSFAGDVPPSFGRKEVDARGADESVLRNWKAQASSSLMSVLDANELLFPMVQVGNYCSEWILVRNPSPEPVVMQLILNSGEIIDNCKNPEMLLQPSSSSTLVGAKLVAPTRYGFSVAKDALMEALIHPYGSASLGPIFFQPSYPCEWRSSVLIRNNLSGVEWLSLRGFGGSLSVVLLEGSDPVQSLEFKLNQPTQLNFSSLDILHSIEGKSPSCSQPLTREVYPKNVGDLPLEVKHIKISGADCGLDGFLVHDCKGFSLQPGESVRLQISYLADFSAASIQRDLELVLATGILVIPMKASLPIYLINFCKRSMFWIRVKKVIFMLLFAASLLYLLVSLLFPRVTAFASEDFKTGKNSFPTVLPMLSSLHMHLKLKNLVLMAPEMNGILRSVGGDKVLLWESAARCTDSQSPDQGHLNPSVGAQKQTKSISDPDPESTLLCTAMSKFSSIENSNMQDLSDSRNLKVRVGKEKGRRRRKKNYPGAGAVFDVSSSQSGNSTPSSPLSPVSSITPKRPSAVSPGMVQSVEVRNPFMKAPDQRSNKSRCSEPSSNVSILANEVNLRRDNQKSGLPAQEKPSLTRKVAGKALLLPSATFPSANRVVPTWTCHSPFLASTSAIAPHARAPGTKLHNQKISDHEVKMGVEEKFTYDIWGDHLFGLPLTQKSNDVPGNNSHSFFMRDPQTLVKNSLLKSVSPNMDNKNN